ncbi:MAG: TetR/AcrR family transcriptional regulator [Cytophagales bacterium]|nr:TetR/AcrR family transcriptional regulator [Armatimonadota bacterium]
MTNRSIFTADEGSDADRQDLRFTILDAAERLVEHYGYKKMTMQDLAREAGIGVGTTYLHFKGKGDVAVGVLERANDRVLHSLRDIADSDRPAPERLRRMLEERILRHYESARCARHSMDELMAVLRPHIQSRVAEWTHAERVLFERVLADGERQGQFRWETPLNRAETVADTLLNATNGMMPDAILTTDFDDPEAFRQKVERLAALLMRSVERQCRETIDP